MSDSTISPQPSDDSDEATASAAEAWSRSAQAWVERSRLPSLIWLVPLLAALVGAGIAWDAITSQGPLVKLTMIDGEGIEAGKTRIKYRAIDVGVIEEVRLSDDLDSVIAHARLDPEAARFLRSETIFWRVKPRVSFSGVSGLETLLSGSYIAVLPADGERQRSFAVLDEPPAIAEHRGALLLELYAEELGSIGVGSPVTYRSVKVGEVLRHQLAGDGREFQVQIMVYPNYAHLVREGSEFWNTSGFDIHLDSQGFRVEVSSLASVLVGGVSFDTPPEAWQAPQVGDGARFALQSNFDDLARSRSRNEGLRLLVEARSAEGLREGAPVFYRKLEVGTVGRSELSEDATTVRTEVHIRKRFAGLVRENSRFWTSSGMDFELGAQGLTVETPSVVELIAGGLEFATPDRLGTPVENGHLFGLHDEPESDWLAWAPRIHVEGAPDSDVVHAIDPDAHAQKSIDIVLEASAASSLSPGDPIYFRQVQVGVIGAHSLSPNARSVRIVAHIDERYAELVRDNSRFWNVSGVDVRLGLSGLKVKTGGLTSMISGGVAFATPDEPGQRIEPGALFELHEEPEDRWLRWSPELWIEATADAADPADPARSPAPVSSGPLAEAWPRSVPASGR